MENAGERPIAHSGAHVRKYPKWPDRYHFEHANFYLQTSDGYEFGVSKMVLLLKSDFFAALFDNDMVEKRAGRAVLPDISGDGLFEVLMFIYEGKLTGNHPNVVEQVCNAAEMFNLAGLKKSCEEKLIDQISFDSIVKSIEIAKLYGMNRLYNGILQFIGAQCENPLLPWCQLGKFCAVGKGKFLKDLVNSAVDRAYVALL